MKHGLVVVWAVLVGGAVCSAQEPASRLQETNGFTGKLLVVYTQDSGPLWPTVISDYVIQNISGKTFLVGTSVRYHDQQWDYGKRTWISWTSIHRVIEFNSIEEYKARLKTPKGVESGYR